jgi:hypothetical protein
VHDAWCHLHWICVIVALAGLSAALYILGEALFLFGIREPCVRWFVGIAAFVSSLISQLMPSNLATISTSKKQPTQCGSSELWGVRAVSGPSGELCRWCRSVPRMG